MSISTPQEEDIVGDRVLVGLQSVRVSRLSTHPVPIAAGTLIAVAGQGPKDSNGAGKSSLLRAVPQLSGGVRVGLVCCCGPATDVWVGMDAGGCECAFK